MVNTFCTCTWTSLCLRDGVCAVQQSWENRWVEGTRQHYSAWLATLFCNLTICAQPQEVAGKDQLCTFCSSCCFWSSGWNIIKFSQQMQTQRETKENFWPCSSLLRELIVLLSVGQLYKIWSIVMLIRGRRTVRKKWVASTQCLAQAAGLLMWLMMSCINHSTPAFIKLYTVANIIYSREVETTRSLSYRAVAQQQPEV